MDRSISYIVLTVTLLITSLLTVPNRLKPSFISNISVTNQKIITISKHEKLTGNFRSQEHHLLNGTDHVPGPEPAKKPTSLPTTLSPSTTPSFSPSTIPPSTIQPTVLSITIQPSVTPSTIAPTPSPTRIIGIRLYFTQNTQHLALILGAITILAITGMGIYSILSIYYNQLQKTRKRSLQLSPLFSTKQKHDRKRGRYALSSTGATFTEEPVDEKDDEEEGLDSDEEKSLRVLQIQRSMPTPLLIKPSSASYTAVKSGLTGSGTVAERKHQRSHYSLSSMISRNKDSPMDTFPVTRLETVLEHDEEREEREERVDGERTTTTPAAEQSVVESNNSISSNNSSTNGARNTPVNELIVYVHSILFPHYAISGSNSPATAPAPEEEITATATAPAEESISATGHDVES